MTGQSGIRDLLFERAKALDVIRSYFRQQNVIEVDTRLLDQFSVTDPYMSALTVYTPNKQQVGFLQTSPEYAMKRLLSQGSGDIYQLSKMFRAEENGRFHDSEFTMLEWYRTGFSLESLMDDVYQLISHVIGKRNRITLTYQNAFLKYLNIDPFKISDKELISFSEKKLGDIPKDMLRDNYLTLLFSECIESSLPTEDVTFIIDYPTSQSALAKLKSVDGYQVAERFEVYCNGIELANGFYELTDPDEQLKRFENDNIIRTRLGYPEMVIDHRLIDALQKGLPECSGVALGFDRLLMIKLGKTHISDVLPLDAG